MYNHQLHQVATASIQHSSNTPTSMMPIALFGKMLQRTLDKKESVRFAAIEWSAGCQQQCSVSDKSPTCSIDSNCTRACAGQAAFCRGCDSKQHNCSVCTQGCVHCHVWDPMSPAHCAKATATHDQFAIVTLKTDERDSWVKKGARVLPSSIKKVLPLFVSGG